MLAFALTIFVGAFLLFQVQPLIAKYILPWFGGSPGVWTTCMLFFQVLLLVGYAYAHFTSRWLKPRVQAVLHLVLLAAALALFPIVPADSWKAVTVTDPTLRILGLLVVSVGLPYFVLSATGPLMQQWFSLSQPGRSPYRLYALSNVGSLLALVSFPFVVEPHLTRQAQAVCWRGGLALFTVGCAACAWRLWKSVVQSPESRVQSPQPGSQTPTGAAGLETPIWTRLLWLVLPACASVLLLATTNKMCQDVAVVPFLWVLPLSVYLLTFIICFDSPRWYERLPFRPALLVVLPAFCWAIPQGADTPLLLLLAVYSAGLFVCCMVCHGELYRLKPDPRHLTAFYLMIAAGGALGGVLVAVVAPQVFNDYYELHGGVLGCGVLALATMARDHRPESQTHWRWVAWLLPVVVLVGLDRLVSNLVGKPGETVENVQWGYRLGFGLVLVYLAYLALESRTLERPGVGLWRTVALVLAPWAAPKRFAAFQSWRRLACGWLAVGLVVLGAGLWRVARHNADLVVERVRNFYGVLTVFEAAKDMPLYHHRSLVHGRVIHGLQLLDPVAATWPTTYFGTGAGVGLAVQALPKGDRRIGVAGLGIGTLAAYGRTNDYFRFYEINPEALRMARTFFTYLGHCQATNQCELGDARLVLEQEPPQDFDLLVLDAFAGDSPPVHLLTREAFLIYQRHLKTNGVIAVNVSNKYLNLEPVIAKTARELGWHYAVVDTNPWDPATNPEAGTAAARILTPSDWVLLTRDPILLETPSIRKVARLSNANPAKVRLWTDDFTSLFQILR